MDTFVTLQNVYNTFYAPFCIFNEKSFIEIFRLYGYEVVDDWDNPFDSVVNDVDVSIPFHRDIRIYVKGFYFRRSKTDKK